MDFIQRLREPSTYAGFGTLAMLFFHVPQTTVEVVQSAIIAVASALAVILPEIKK